MSHGSPRRVLVTGAAGFIGSHVARLLVSQGHDVTLILRDGSNLWRLDDVRSRLQIVYGDLANLSPLVDRLREARPEICIHLAWKGWSGKAEADANLTSLGMSVELLRLMPSLGCPRFVGIGTCFEYEPSARVLREDTPLTPHDLYGTCKKSLFEVAGHFSALTGVSVVTARVFYSYGPYEDSRRLVPSITHALLSGEVANVTPGEQVRDYLHVADVAGAIWAVAQSELTGAVNIASGVPVTIADVARQLARVVGRPDLLRLGALKYRDGEPMHILGDAARLSSIGWRPRFDLNHGLADTVSWWQAREARA